MNRQEFFDKCFIAAMQSTIGMEYEFVFYVGKKETEESIQKSIGRCWAIAEAMTDKRFGKLKS